MLAGFRSGAVVLAALRILASVAAAVVRSAQRRGLVAVAMVSQPVSRLA